MPKLAIPHDLLKYDNGQAYFETDHGHIYTYNFENITPAVIEHVSPIFAVYDITFHYFGFIPENNNNLRFDSRISPTLSGIVEAFFSDGNKVILYVCDAMDGRAKARQRLFSNWIEKYEAYVLYQVNIEIGDDIIYCGVLTNAKLSDRGIFESEFIDKAENIFKQKF